MRYAAQCRSKALLSGGALIAALSAISGCSEYSNLSYSEALECVDAVILSGEGEGVFSEMVEVSTNFPIGVPIEEAVPGLATYFETQAPCALVSADGATVTVDFGSIESSCALNEHVYGGVVAIEITSTLDSAVQVLHTWTGLTNGVITINGTGDVTWSGAGPGHTRHVVHQLSWTRADGSTVDASGDRLQALQLASEGLAGGMVVSGNRDWTYSGDPWHAAINDIEIIGVDPVPEDGSYNLTMPSNQLFNVSFERNDDEDDTIRIVVHGNIDSYPFDVTRSGEMIDG